LGIVSIDLGSNSFRVLKYDCKEHKTIAEFEKTVGTADGLIKSKKISNKALKRIIDAINESKKIVDYKGYEAVAMTTQAMRVASNSKEILQSIKDQTDVSFTIIDGIREAKLTLLAMQYALKRENLPSDDFILLDIGGGSTELIIYQDSKEIIKSFPYGIVTLSQSNDKIKDFNLFKDLINDFIKDKNILASQFLSTAGTPTTIAAIKQGLDFQSYDKYKVNGTTLNLLEIQNIQNKLLNLSKDQLEKKVGTGRDDYIDTGIEIYKLFYKSLKKDLSIVFDDGLREGIAIEQCLKQVV